MENKGYDKDIEELADVLILALPYVEDALECECNKKATVRKFISRIKETLDSVEGRLRKD
jgi:hypothetical protein